MKLADYKAGQRYRVTSLPAECDQWPPTEGSGHYLQNGDIITLSNPPVVQYDVYCEYTFNGQTFYTNLLLRYKPFGNYILSEWITPIGDPRPICACNIWTTGCICGVFAAENEGEGAGR